MHGEGGGGEANDWYRGVVMKTQYDLCNTDVDELIY